MEVDGKQLAETASHLLAVFPSRKDVAAHVVCGPNVFAVHVETAGVAANVHFGEGGTAHTATFPHRTLLRALAATPKRERVRLTLNRDSGLEMADPVSRVRVTNMQTTPDVDTPGPLALPSQPLPNDLASLLLHACMFTQTGDTKTENVEVVDSEVRAVTRTSAFRTSHPFDIPVPFGLKGHQIRRIVGETPERMVHDGTHVGFVHPHVRWKVSKTKLSSVNFDEVLELSDEHTHVTFDVRHLQIILFGAERQRAEFVKLTVREQQMFVEYGDTVPTVKMFEALPLEGDVFTRVADEMTANFSTKRLLNAISVVRPKHMRLHAALHSHKVARFSDGTTQTYVMPVRI